jgi:hypothetical protein
LLRVLFDPDACISKTAIFETNAHDRPDGCLWCDWLPFSCAIRLNRTTAAASD